MAQDTQKQQHVQDSFWSKDKSARRKPDHPVVRATFERMAEFVASSVDNPGHASVLDVGCGNGFLQLMLERRFQSVAGVDYSQEMLKVNPCKEKHLGCCTQLPFPDKSYDVAVASHLLHHLTEADRIQTLREMKRVARKMVVSFEPNRNNPLMLLFALITPEERMALNFSSGYMRQLFSQAGFSSIHTQVQGWIVPNKAPVWWIPVGRALEKSPFRKIGLDIYTTARVSSV